MSALSPPQQNAFMCELRGPDCSKKAAKRPTRSAMPRPVMERSARDKGKNPAPSSVKRCRSGQFTSIDSRQRFQTGKAYWQHDPVGGEDWNCPTPSHFFLFSASNRASTNASRRYDMCSRASFSKPQRVQRGQKANLLRHLFERAGKDHTRCS